MAARFYVRKVNAMALKKLCPNCKRVLIDQTADYCSVCRGAVSQRRKNNNQRYDHLYRNKDAKAFYASVEWQQARIAALVRFGYLDIYDYYVNRKLTRAATVHHIVELDEDWEQRLTLENLLPLSESNHNKIHGLYAHSRQATQAFLQSLVRRWLDEIGGGG